MVSAIPGVPAFAKFHSPSAGSPLPPPPDDQPDEAERGEDLDQSRPLIELF
jgi:hypothetical protein